jgi:hypothetical protein
LNILFLVFDNLEVDVVVGTHSAGGVSKSKKRRPEP